ncbi:MAG: helix-turn-helix domain-containing protein [Pseudomonadales bacterium]|nr:helix-turn-helix domain-containing protein [Pseudomonadales bacterium]
MTPQQLKLLRERLGLSQDEMAARLGYEGAQRRSIISKMESGRLRIQPATPRMASAIRRLQRMRGKV